MTWKFVIAYAPEDCETPQGFSRANEDRLNSLRIGNLVIAFGKDD